MDQTTVSRSDKGLLNNISRLYYVDWLRAIAIYAFYYTIVTDSLIMIILY
jgi:hypothetical protein